MSHTTDVLVYLNSQAGDFPTAEREALIQPFGEHAPLRLVDTDGIVGDGKAFTAAVYAGAFNYLDIEAFIQWLTGLPWDYDTGVVAIIDDEQNPILAVLRRVDGGSGWQVKT